LSIHNFKSFFLELRRRVFSSFILYLHNLFFILKLYLRSNKKSKNTKLLIVHLQDFNQGRYGFQLINYLSLAGYDVTFYRSFKFLLFLKSYDRLIYKIPNISIWKNLKRSNNTLTSYLFLKQDSSFKIKNRIENKFCLDLNYFKSFEQGNKSSIIMPFFIHPNMNKYYLIDKPVKKNRILFYGSDNTIYNSDEIKNKFNLLSRFEVFHCIQQSEINLINPNNIDDLLDRLDNPTIRNEFFFIDSNKIWIPEEKWLNVLSSFDFFIATPGVIMPQSHNSIEAMLTETILITQYAKWFSPSLVDKVNCLEYKDQNELFSVINFAMNLSDEEISYLRRNSNHYFNNYIKPSSLVNRIEELKESSITLVYNAEEYSVSEY
jgi:hypothetical protein